MPLSLLCDRLSLFKFIIEDKETKSLLGLYIEVSDSKLLFDKCKFSNVVMYDKSSGKKYNELELKSKVFNDYNDFKQWKLFGGILL
jgi:hypothetical protein